MIIYRINLERDGSTWLVTSPDFRELTTFGDDETDAKAHAIDAIEEALAARISAGQDVPLHFDQDQPIRDGDTLVKLPLLSSLKVYLYALCREMGVTRADLMRRLGWSRESVDRLFRLDHASKPAQLEAAFHALGREVAVDIKLAA